MQEKLQIPRKKLREVVAASLKKISEEQLKRKRRIYELSGLPFNAKEEEKNTKAVAEFMVDPYTDHLLGTLNDEEFLKVIEKNIFDLWTKNAPEAQKFTEEDSKMMQSALAMLLNSIVAEFKDSDEKVLQYYNCVFELAKRKKVAPRAIFESDASYKELLRRVYGYEEQKTREEKALAFLDADKLSDFLIKPFLKSMTKNEEEFAEFYAEMKDALVAIPEFQEKIGAIKTASMQVMKEELDRIYGKKSKTRKNSK